MSTTERSIRCSSLPLALKCPASQVKPSVRLGEDSEPARLGSAVHQVLACWIECDATDSRHIDDAAAMFRVDAEEVARLAWNGWRCWERLRPMFPDPEVERELVARSGDLTITGHVDVISCVDSQVRILDHKTGREDSDYVDQLRGYAWAALNDEYVTADSAYAAVVWLREQEVEGFTWTRDELDAWYEGIEDRLGATNVYHPGRHCGFCPRRQECSVRLSYVSSSIAEILDVQPVLNPTPYNIIAVYDRLKIIKAACDMADDMIRSEVEAAGGRIDTETRSLIIKDITTKRINAAPAWPILTDRFGAEVVLGAARLSKEAVEQMAKEAAPPRMKGNHAAALIEELDAAGAVTTTISKRLESKRNVNAITSTAAGDERGIETSGSSGNAPGLVGSE